MKLTNGEIYNSKGAMEKLLQMRLPARTSYALLKMAGKLNEQLNVIEAVRVKLVQEHGKPDEKMPNIFRVTPDCLGYTQFLTSFGDILGEEVELDIEQVKLPETLEIEPAVLMALEPFVTI